MEEIFFSCQKCGTEIEVDGEFAGGLAECPECENVIIVPFPGAYPGMQIDDFRLEEQIGFGETGAVWLAYQTSAASKVILKILSPILVQNQEIFDAFQSEIEKISEIDHPNIARTITAGCDKGIHFVAVNYVDGESLNELLKYAIIPERIVLKYAKSVIEALNFAWTEKKLFHRNITPSNIMITEDGEAILTDMGIARSLFEDTTVTNTGMIMGAPTYMSPEMARLDDDVDFRTDIYSLGATMYFISTGEKPFKKKNSREILISQTQEPFPRPSAVNPSLSPQFDRLIEVMTEKSAKYRQKSWQAVLDDIEQVTKGESPKINTTPKSHTTSKPLAVPKKLSNGHKVKRAKRHQKKTENLQSAKKVSVLATLIIITIIAALFYVISHNGNAKTRTVKKVDFNDKSNNKHDFDSDSDEMPNARLEWEFQNKLFQADSFTNKCIKARKDYDKAIHLFEELKKHNAGTKYLKLLNESIKKINEAKKREVNRIIDKLHKNAKPHVDKKAFKAAINIYANYKGPLSEETSEQRERYRKKYLAESQKANEKKRLKKPQKNKK